MSPTLAAPAEPGDFARLLETERRLEARLEQARQEGQALIAAAQADATAREAALAADIEAAERRVVEALESDRKRREAEIAETARTEVERYEGVAAAHVDRLARSLARRLVEAPAP